MMASLCQHESKESPKRLEYPPHVSTRLMENNAHSPHQHTNALRLNVLTVFNRCRDEFWQRWWQLMKILREYDQDEEDGDFTVTVWIHMTMLSVYSK